MRHALLVLEHTAYLATCQCGWRAEEACDTEQEAQEDYAHHLIAEHSEQVEQGDATQDNESSF